MNQLMLDGFNPSEEDLTDIAMRQPLDVKIEKTIRLIQTFEVEALELSDYGYFLAFSGRSS